MRNPVLSDSQAALSYCPGSPQAVSIRVEVETCPQVRSEVTLERLEMWQLGEVIQGQGPWTTRWLGVGSA